MGKTDTIKQRAVWVYLPTIEQRKEWEQIAEQQGSSLSKWIVKTVEDSLNEIQDKTKSRKELEEENKDLKNEISKLQKKLRETTRNKETLEKEIKKYRAEPFLSPQIDGEREYDKELIKLLRNAKTREGKTRYMDNEEILSRLGIEPTETEAVKAVSSQLSHLEDLDLVKSGTKGWRWKE